MNDASPAARRPPRVPRPSPPPVTDSPRVERLRAELAHGDEGAVARLWAEARRGTPLVEDVTEGHCTVTFLWRDRHGTGPGTRQVVLIANRLTDPSVWEDSVLHRVPGTDVWHRSYRLPDTWRATYQLAPEDGHGRGLDNATGAARRWRGLDADAEADPLNPRMLRERSGANASVVELPGAPEDRWSRDVHPDSRGRLTEHRVPGVSAPHGARRVWAHVPNGLTARDRPALLILLDGDDWVARLGGPRILDALAACRAVPPFVTLLPDAGDASHRDADLAADQGFLSFLADTLIPWARDELHAGERTYIAGQSLGGLTALTLALDRPGLLAGVLAQSASLWWAPPGAAIDGADAASHTASRAARLAPGTTRFVLEVGELEWVLLPQHRHLRDVLRDGGHDVVLREFCGGHEALCWRAGLGDALVALMKGDPRP